MLLAEKQYRPLLPGMGILETKVVKMRSHEQPLPHWFQTGWGATPTSSTIIPMLNSKNISPH